MPNTQFNVRDEHHFKRKKLTPEQTPELNTLLKESAIKYLDRIKIK